MDTGLEYYILLHHDKGPKQILEARTQRAQPVAGVKMDTWFKWWVTAIYTFVSTEIVAFAGDALIPFFNNVIQDHKTKYMPYSKITCLLLVQCFTIYGMLMSVIGMFVALTQVDFMLIRIAADLIVNSHTTSYFLKGKEVDAMKYNTWKQSGEVQKICSGMELSVVEDTFDDIVDPGQDTKPKLEPNP